MSCLSLGTPCDEWQSWLSVGLRPEPNASAVRLAGIAGSGEKLMKFRPLHDRVVVRRIEGEDKTKGGIIIPDTVKEKPQEGEVIAVGPGARTLGTRPQHSPVS